MSEFTFIGNLEICRTGSSKTEETEASLQADIAATDKLINEVSEQILNLSGHLEELKRKKEVLQKKIDSFSKSYTEIQLGTPLLTKASSIDEKILFLFDLFHGRRDVYAVRKWNEKTGKHVFNGQAAEALQDSVFLI